MSAEAYPDRDGRTYNNHGIEHTLAQFTTGDTVHVDADMAAHTGTYTFKSYSLDPDLHITLEDEKRILVRYPPLSERPRHATVHLR